MLRKKTPLLLITLALIGCAKEKEYDTVYKDVDLTSRGSIKITRMETDKDGNQVEVPVKYMYVPMTEGTPRKIRQAYPFFQGDEKLVRLQWAEDGLEVLEIERDSRFADNEFNDLPVMTIPVEYSAYRCKEDEFGDCTNVEEENDELEWFQKEFFVPDFTDVKISEVGTQNFWNVGEDSCTSVKNTRLVDYEISDGVINFEVEKTFSVKATFRCTIQSWIDDDLSVNSFKTNFHYSLVELDKLASPDYQPVNYPIPDHGKLGFFTSREERFSPDFDFQRPQERYFLNRFNPNQPNGELVYYLTKNFNKPENKILLDATYEAIEVMNKGLEKINNPFKIVVKQQEDDAKEIAVGDLRYNMIVLLEDPLSNGLLGYGPSVKNPLTGEILKAHTNMYGGILRAISRRGYDEAVDISEQRYEDAQNVALDSQYTVAPSALATLPTALAATLATSEQPAAASEAEATGLSNIQIERLEQLPVDEAVLGNMTVKRLEQMLDNRMKSMTHNNRIAIEDLLSNGDPEMSEFERQFLEYEKEFHGVSSIHKHKPEFFPIGGTSKVIFEELKLIPGIVHEETGVLKRWEILNQSQRNEIVNVIIKKAWTATLIHEVGHNLGLRHNFSGSHDRHNFLTNDDLASYDIVSEHRPAYSSIMDYAFSEYNQLASFGNYDLAALRFAYNREIEVMDQASAAEQDACEASIRTNPSSLQICKPNVRVIKVNEPLVTLEPKLQAAGLTRKSYEFCTDENAGLSSSCNRFDEGTNLVEIAKFRTENFDRLYKYRNFRDGRLDFNTQSLAGYIFRVRRELSTLRDIVEDYEFFVGIFGEDLMAAGCSPQQVAQFPVCGMVNDRRDAVQVVGDALINILKTPDHLCAAVKADAPTVVVAYKKLAEIYDEIKFNINYVPKTCFDAAVKEQLATEDLIPVGETGKFLNGFKDTDPNFRYAQDRAVLGTWPDKVMAMRGLFNRTWKNRSTDTEHMALVDIPSIQEKTLNVLAHYLLGNSLDNPIPFKAENGATFQIPYVIGNEYQAEQLEDFFWWIKRYLNMQGQGKSNLIDMLLAQTSRGTAYGEDFKEQAYQMSNLASVRISGRIPESQRVEEYSYVDIGDRTFYAGEANQIAKFMIDGINAKSTLDNTERALVEKVFKQRTNPDAPEVLNEQQASLFKQQNGLIQQLIELSGREFETEEQRQQFLEQIRPQLLAIAGPEDGANIFELFVAGPEAMAPVLQLKMVIMNNPVEGASAEEQALFELPVQVMGAFLQGGLSDEVMNFYRLQIQKMPQHTYRAI
ncbi:MAG: hypothetical protein CME65_00765 [Halobacteriovoraceae bacterium]|nr:hypothetical protein [Halobacteriovoraceae bacterium]